MLASRSYSALGRQKGDWNSWLPFPRFCLVVSWFPTELFCVFIHDAWDGGAGWQSWRIVLSMRQPTAPASTVVFKLGCHFFTCSILFFLALVLCMCFSPEDLCLQSGFFFLLSKNWRLTLLTELNKYKQHLWHMQARASKVVFKVGLKLRCYCYCGLLSFVFVGLFWCGASSQLFLMGLSWVVQGLDTHV